MTQQIGGGGLGVTNQMDRSGADFSRVVRRDGRCHADGDTGRAIRQQVGKRTGQYDGFGFFPVIGGTEIYGVLADAGQHRGGDLGQPRFGVAHRRGVIAVHIAEIALAFHQRVAGGEFLRHAHHGVVDRGVAMRMELAHHVAHHAGAFLEAGAGIQPQQLHGVDQPAVDGLQTVAHIRQRTRHDGGQRVGEIALRQRIPQLRVLDMSGRVIRHRCPQSSSIRLYSIRSPVRRCGHIASAAPGGAAGAACRMRHVPGSGQ